MRFSLAMLGIGIVVVLVAIAFALQKQGTITANTVVAVNVTEGNSSWKITNSGTTPVDVEVRNAITGFVIRKLDVGKAREIPKENVNITVRQNG